MPGMPHTFKWSAILFMLLLGAVLRIYVTETVPEEVDENNYLAPAVDFRQATSHHDWSGFLNVNRNFEHPPLVKLLYSLTIDDDELQSLPADFGSDFLEQMSKSLVSARRQAVVWGIITVLAVALISPAAGLVMAVQSMLVYYTGIAYLDALPMMFTALMAWLYTRETHPDINFWLSGMCLGAAAAGKYPFALGGVAIMIHALSVRHYALRDLLRWGLLAVIVFFALNPYLWTDPIGRLHAQLTFHQEYAGIRHYSLLVPWRQFLFPHHDIRYTEGLLLPQGMDVLIFLLALPGGVLLLRQKSVFGIWLVMGMIFLMFWRAQWIQHNMIIAVPYCMSAAESINWLWNRLQPPIYKKINAENNPPS